MTVGAIPNIIIALAVIGLVFIIMGFLLDAVLTLDNQLMSDPTLPYSNERAVTLGYLVIMFKWLGVIAVFCAILFLQMNANQADTGEI